MATTDEGGLPPKCRSWLGHKFRPRYSLGPSRKLSVEEAYWLYGSEARLDAMERSRTSTYECDVCVRCGAVAMPPVQIVNQTAELPHD